MVPEPSARVPLVKVIVPVTPLGTVAAIVTEPPNVLGLGDAPTVTIGVALLTTWVTTFEVSEPNVAVMLCEPKSRVDVVNVAVVPDIVPVPMLVAPSKKVTIPVLPEGKVTVKVTD
jgi:hypothetical protein